KFRRRAYQGTDRSYGICAGNAWSWSVCISIPPAYRSPAAAETVQLPDPARPITETDLCMPNWWNRWRTRERSQNDAPAPAAPLILRSRPARDVDVADLLRRP